MVGYVILRACYIALQCLFRQRVAFAIASPSEQLLLIVYNDAVLRLKCPKGRLSMTTVVATSTSCEQLHFLNANMVSYDSYARVVVRHHVCIEGNGAVV